MRAIRVEAWSRVIFLLPSVAPWKVTSKVPAVGPGSTWTLPIPMFERPSRKLWTLPAPLAGALKGIGSDDLVRFWGSVKVSEKFPAAGAVMRCLSFWRGATAEPTVTEATLRAALADMKSSALWAALPLKVTIYAVPSGLTEAVTPTLPESATWSVVLTAASSAPATSDGRALNPIADVVVLDAAIALALGTLAAVRARPKSVNVAVAEPTCRYPVWLPAAPLAR
ncbi:MAG: hypothetical protein E6J51_13400 [Chloroflexi bacterium]|nr:MAG: hypothetical protein E6J51_13400 [Chloroflexota bacterium]